MSPVPARTVVLAMTWDKVTSAHAQRDSEEKIAKVRRSIKPEVAVEKAREYCLSTRPYSNL